MSRRPVAVVTTRCHPDLGGIESHVGEVTRRLVALGHDVEVLTTDRTGRLPRSEVVDGYRIRRFRALPRERDWYASPGLAWWLLRHRYAAVHVQGIHTLVPPLAMLLAWLARRRLAHAFALARVLAFHLAGHLLCHFLGTLLQLLQRVGLRADGIAPTLAAKRFRRIAHRALGPAKGARDVAALAHLAHQVAQHPAERILGIGRAGSCLLVALAGLPLALLALAALTALALLAALTLARLLATLPLLGPLALLPALSLLPLLALLAFGVFLALLALVALVEQLALALGQVLQVLQHLHLLLHLLVRPAELG